MSEIITVGLDLAKNVFQVQGADGTGRAVLRKPQEAEACAGAGVLQPVAALRHRDGSLSVVAAPISGGARSAS